MPLPPLSFSSSASSSASLDSMGNAWGVSGAGDWNINLAGSGTALQAGGSTPVIAWVALGLAAAWLLSRIK